MFDAREQLLVAGALIFHNEDGVVEQPFTYEQLAEIINDSFNEGLRAGRDMIYDSEQRAYWEKYLEMQDGI